MQQITIHGTGKVATADIQIKNDEVDVIGLSIYHENGTQSHYGKKQCSKHEWMLYKLVKNYMYE